MNLDKTPARRVCDLTGDLMQPDSRPSLTAMTIRPTVDLTRALVVLYLHGVGLAALRVKLRRGEMFSSCFAFLMSFTICFIGLGYGAYSYATWLLGA
jgi:hypothetical protein